MGVKILKEINCISSIERIKRIQFNQDRYFSAYRLIKKSAQIKKLYISSICNEQKDEEFLTVVRINEIILGKNYTKLICEELYNGKSYYYDVLVKTDSEEKKDLYCGLIIGVLLRAYNDTLYLVDLIWPHNINKTKFLATNENGYILAISDVHVGSVYFNEPAFLNCISFVNENKNIKYLVIAGDLIEGINVYKSQQEHLTLDSLSEQELKLLDYLTKFRTDLCIILCPGNHDNHVGIAEPQKSIYHDWYKTHPNIIPVTNPAFLNIDGLDYIVYHGRSQNSFLRQLPHIKINNAIEVLKIMLKSGHLAPVVNELSVNKITDKDYLVVETLPHILHLGHTHIAFGKHSEGISYVNGGSFQHPTDYQKKLNIIPHTGSGILINIADYRILELINFNE